MTIGEPSGSTTPDILRDSQAGCGVIAYALAGAVVWHLGARPPEERDLIQRFGEPYRHYRDTVPLWWPRRRPYSPRARR